MMKQTIKTILLLFSVHLLIGTGLTSCQNPNQNENSSQDTIVMGATQMSKYLPKLEGKRVGVTINNTSVVDGKSLIDTLIGSGINVTAGFGPEHGIRGAASAGAKIYDEVDSITGIKLVSLYGEKYKPTKEDMSLIDVMIFDIQDVGVRFYTYLSTLHYVMEACAENNVELIVLDRPNPNDGYIDGPVLEKGLESFVGMHPIPIVHGLTLGELATMINAEKYLSNAAQCKLTVIPMENYYHGKKYKLPINPSPNLNTEQSILLYPSTCLYEGTKLSEGRGTMSPFMWIGSPELKGAFEFSFKPVSIPGMSEKPKHMDVECFGLDLSNYDTDIFLKEGRINLSWLKDFYQAYPKKDEFFNGGFDRLAGTVKLKEQIKSNLSDAEIHASWEPELAAYKERRTKYLLYKDGK